MNQAILNLIDDKIYWMYKVVTEDWPQDEYYSEWQQALLDLKNEISSLPSDTQWYTKKEVLDFAYWYHNWLLNRDRWDVEVEFDDFIKYHRKWLIPNKIIWN